MTPKPAHVDQWITRHLQEDAPHARSLIITLFGDSVAPYSDGIWLSDLIELLAPFGVNERLVRTSVFRLAEDNWLAASREGRRSYYTLAPAGRRRFQYAYHRVYTPPTEWDGRWTVVLAARSAGPAGRASLRDELEWEGYASVAPGVFVRPAVDGQALRDSLRELKLDERVVVLEGGKAHGGGAIGELVAQGWDLDSVAKGYLGFLDQFEPLMNLVDGARTLPAEQAFVVQTLLIDSFRRITLHDPRLPASLLPASWPGEAAYRLCHRLYRKTYRLVRAHVLPRFMKPSLAAHVPAEILRRFGGL